MKLTKGGKRVETRKMKILIGKKGGNSSVNSVGYKITLPNLWMKEWGIMPDDREVNVRFDGEKIIITK